MGSESINIGSKYISDKYIIRYHLYIIQQKNPSEVKLRRIQDIYRDVLPKQ